MAEYIDKAILLDHLDIENALGGHYGISLTEINKLPASDVRPVVLCKDCKYAERVCMPDGRVWCNENLFSRLDEDFCSRGEKREES